MYAVLAVALGGACGALARYGAGQLVRQLVDSPFPWATWTVNLTGCLLIGAAVPLLAALHVGEEARFFLVVGFLGSFTTFSTYSLDTLALFANGHGLFALLNAAGSVVAGLIFVWIGRAIGDVLIAG
jgi:CrcB protein